MTLVNSLLAGAIALLVVRSIASMDRGTSHTVRLAMLLLLIAGTGQALGFFFAVWDHYLDTLMYGGVLMLLIANVRSPNWFVPVWSRRLAMGTFAATWLIVLGYLAINQAQARTAPRIAGAWIVNLREDPAKGTVTLRRSDFDAIVWSYNDQLDEISGLRLRGCR